MTRTWVRRGNLIRETENLLIVTQNNAIRTNHVKAKINNTWENKKYRLCGDRDETVNHIISKFKNKIEQTKYKTKYSCVEKVIQ